MGRISIIDRPITDMATPWEFYTGTRVETFIKDELKKRVGYMNMIGSYLYAFTDYDHYTRYIDDKLSNPPLFMVDMNYTSDDIWDSLVIETSSSSEATDENNVHLKYYFITTDKDSGEQLYVENRECQLSITVSTDGSTFYEVYTSTVKSMAKDSSVYSNVVLPDFQYDDFTTYTYHVKLHYNNIESNMLTFVRHMNPKPLLKPTKDSYTYPQTDDYLISYNICDYGDNLDRYLQLDFTDMRGITVSKGYKLSSKSYVTNPFSQRIIHDEIDLNFNDNKIIVGASLYKDGDHIRSIIHYYHYGYYIKSCIQTYPVYKQIPYIINGQNTYITDIVMYNYTNAEDYYINIDVFDDDSLTNKIYSDKIVNPVQNTWYQIYLNINTNMTERSKHIWIQLSLSGGHNSISGDDYVADPLILETYLVNPLTE